MSLLTRCEARLGARFVRFAIIGLVGLAALWPARAAAQDSSVTFNVGYFGVTGEDGRDENDVLFRNLDFLLFEVDDFNNATFGGEWSFGLGNYLEVGAGANYYSRSVPSIYTDFADDDGTEIEQDLKLRIVPVTFLARVFPTGRQAAFQPYVGAGLGVFAWRYSETGEFVDFTDFSVFRGTFEDSGTALGPVIVAGLRFASDAWLVGGEFRWQDASADLDLDEGFAGDEIDLGGYNVLFTFGVRF